MKLQLCMILPILGFLSLAVVVAGDSNDTETNSEKKLAQYVFDQDRAGAKCTKFLDDIRASDDGDIERFKLFCVNKGHSFHLCALTCSDALHFEGSSGKCRQDKNCNFYDTTFVEHSTGDNLSMRNVAHGKATLVAVVPLWDSQAQYFYELLEQVRKDYGDSDTEALLLPMELDVDNPWEEEEFAIRPFHTQRVTLLNNTHPSRFGSHPLMAFLTTLRHVSGFQHYDVYTDRPVLFIVSPDGKLVERLVVPTYAQIEEVLTGKFGLENKREETTDATDTEDVTKTVKPVETGEL